MSNEQVQTAKPTEEHQKRVLLLMHRGEYLALFKPPLSLSYLPEATISTHPITDVKYARSPYDTSDTGEQAWVNVRKELNRPKQVASVSYNVQPVKMSDLSSEALFVEAMTAAVDKLPEYEMVQGGLHRVATVAGSLRPVPIGDES